MLRRFLEVFSKLFRERQIYDREGGTIYLSRFYLLGGPRTWETKGVLRGQTEGWSKLPFNVMLHKFHRGDDDGALHNHPWKWSFSIILVGGYSEERRVTVPCGCVPGCQFPVWAVQRRKVRPFTVNFIRREDFHRVDLLGKDCWTLFVAGPKASSWGFWDRNTGWYTGWKTYIAQKRAQALGWRANP